MIDGTGLGGLEVDNLNEVVEEPLINEEEIGKQELQARESAQIPPDTVGISNKYCKYSSIF